MVTDTESPKLIFTKEIANLIPYTQNHLRRLEAKGDFPKRIRLGANRVAWQRADIERWIEEKVTENIVEVAQ